MNNIVLKLNGISQTFRQGKNEVKVLRNIDLTVFTGELVALIGPSGAGKSTLLHIAGLLEKPDNGKIEICGRNCADLNDDQRTLVRRDQLGFVYQYHHLLPEFNALENVVLPQLIAGITKLEAMNRGKELLSFMGLSEREKHRPAQLSGGEQQRVAMARALANAPSLLLADEPTGNLDPDTANQVFKLLLKIVRSAGLSAVIATHNQNLAATMDRIIKLEQGILMPGNEDEVLCT